MDSTTVDNVDIRRAKFGYLLSPLTPLLLACLLTLLSSESIGANCSDLVATETSQKVLSHSVSERLSRRQSRLVNRFYETSGFKSPSVLASAIGRWGGVWEKVLQILNNESSTEFVMRTPIHVRGLVEKTGFLNQHATGKSTHSIDIRMKNVVEAYHLGMTFDSFSKLDPFEKIIYGYLRETPGARRPMFEPTYYGPDIFIFRKNRVSHITHFTIGDSGNNFARKFGVTRWSESIQQLVKGPRSWDHFFIPWKHKELLTPFLVNYLQNDMFMINPPRANNGYSELEAQIDYSLVPPELGPKNFQWDMSSRSTSYIELQWLGRRTLEDVEIFEFTTEPPTGEFLQNLIRHGIKIRDGRTWPPTDYSP